MRALVTGADGFLGRHLVQALVEAGHEVVAFTRKARQPRSQLISNSVFDLLDASSLTLDPSRVGPIDVVYHLAALMPDDKTTAEVYTQGNGHSTCKLLDECCAHSISRFVYMSSIGVIGEPQNRPIGIDHPVDLRHPYFTGKRLGEMACIEAQANGITTHIFRLTSPYGPHMPIKTVLPLFVDRALQGRELLWHGSGTRAQDFVFVDDIVAVLLAAAFHHKSGFYCLGSGAATSMRGLAQTIGDLIPQTSIKASGEIDLQEGVVWEAKVDDLINDLALPPFLDIKTGLQRYISALSRLESAWWVE